jgi:hypothetical protein
MLVEPKMLSRAKSAQKSGKADVLNTALTYRQVEEFARKARWEVRCDDPRAHRSRCLDGRYKPGAGVIAMPGADAGLLAIGLAAMREMHSRCGSVMSRAELTNITLHVVGGKQNFSYHTDRTSLAHHESRLDGCSHCRLLACRPGLFAPYSLDSSEIDALQTTLTWLESEHVKPDILRGNHDECAVLIVQNVHNLTRCEPLTAAEIRHARRLWVLDNYAVLRGAGRKRAFVFQRDLARARIDVLAAGLAMAFQPNTGALTDMGDLMDQIAEVHFTRTLKHLASHLPFYNIFIDAHTGEVGVPERLT